MKHKTGGRTKGTPNKKTQLLSEIFEANNMFVPEKIIQLLPDLEPDKQADVLLELMNYLFPKRKALEHSGPDSGPIAIQTDSTDFANLLKNPKALESLFALEKIQSEQNE